MKNDVSITKTRLKFPDIARITSLFGISAPKLTNLRWSRRFRSRGTIPPPLHRLVYEVTETVRRNFCVDDLLKSMKDAHSAIKMYKELTELLFHGGFHVTKWASNKRGVLEEVIPDSELSKELKNVDFEKDTIENPDIDSLRS